MGGMRGRLVLVLAAGLAVLPGCAREDASAEVADGPIVKGGTDVNGEYTGVDNWWRAHPDSAAGYTFGQVSGVVADSPDRILVGIRGERTPEGEEKPNDSYYIVALNRNGEIVERWTQWDSMMGFPHQLYISPYDPERHVWIVDRGGTQKTVHEQILKFTNDGKQLVLRLRDPAPTQNQGGPVARDNPNPGPYDYGQASTMTFLPNGDFLVSDGYQNGRIIRYNPQGELISEFGSVGSGAGQFDLVHGVAVDRDGRIYTADRNNNRIQVFSEAGEFIEEWPNVEDPVGVYIDERDGVWVISAAQNRILKFNTQGVLQHGFGAYGGTLGGFPGGLARPHQLSVDQEGNVYIASYDGPWLNKFTPRPGADPSKLIGQPLKLAR
jgi:peptidylamidoglycolate lyase